MKSKLYIVKIAQCNVLVCYSNQPTNELKLSVGIGNSMRCLGLRRFLTQSLRSPQLQYKKGCYLAYAIQILRLLLILPVERSNSALWFIKNATRRNTTKEGKLNALRLFKQRFICRHELGLVSQGATQDEWPLVLPLLQMCRFYPTPTPTESFNFYAYPF